MSLKMLPIDAFWVDRMIALADSGWDQATIEAHFVEWGWVRDPSNAAPMIEWGGGVGSPHFLTDPDDGGIGFMLYLGPPPPDRLMSIVLPCALSWPTFGDEDEDDPDPDEDDDLEDDDLEDDDVGDDEDDLDLDYGSDWIRFPDAGRAQFLAERDRIEQLIQLRLGEPDEASDLPDGISSRMWRRGAMAIELLVDDDLNSYSHYDLLAIAVGPAER
jgi:hypothetical protein